MMPGASVMWILVALTVGAIVIAVGQRCAGRRDRVTVSTDVTGSVPTSPTVTDSNGAGSAVPGLDYVRRRVDAPDDPHGVPLRQSGPASVPWPAAGEVPAPRGMQWQNYYGLALPYSTSDGPTVVREAMAHGFTRTPQGAALAGHHIFGRHLTGERAARRAVAAAQTHADDDSTWHRYLMAVDRPLPDLATPRMFLRPDAFLVVDYTPDVARVRYAIPLGISGPGEVRRWSAVDEELVWCDGQWKLSVGRIPPDRDPIVSLNGWTRW